MDRFFYLFDSIIPFVYVLFHNLIGLDSDGGLGALLWFLRDPDVTIARGMVSVTFPGVVKTLQTFMVIGIAAWANLLTSNLPYVSDRFLFHWKGQSFVPLKLGLKYHSAVSGAVDFGTQSEMQEEVIAYPYLGHCSCQDVYESSQRMKNAFKH